MSMAEIQEQPLWRQGREEFLRDIQAAAQRLGVLWALPTAYVLRHGGATRDAVMKLRPMAQILRRGRWAHLESIKHYEKHGRLQMSLHRAGQALVTRGREAMPPWPAWFRVAFQQQ